MEKSEIAVGDSTYVEIIFSTKKYSSRVSKRPKIETNEGPPDKRVQIIATVVARPDSTYPAIMRPYKLDLSQFTEKVRDEMEFSIFNVSDKPIQLTMIAGDDEFFKVELPKSIPAGANATGKLKLTDKGTADNFEKSFTFEVNDETKSRFTVPVKRTIRNAAAVTSGDGH